MKKLDKNDDFDEIINDKVLVDFYADWCGPCRQLGKILDDLDDEISIIKVNVDDFKSLAKKYKVMKIPSLKLFDKGKIVNEHAGLLNREQLIDFINSERK